MEPTAADTADPSAPALLRYSGTGATVITADQALDPERLDEIHPAAGLLLIAIEGKPVTYNRLRNNDAAFDMMTTCLPELRARNKDFGFLFTLGPHNVAELPWVAGFAADVGSKLLRVVVPAPMQRTFGSANVDRLADCLQRRFGARMAIRVTIEHDAAPH